MQQLDLSTKDDGNEASLDMLKGGWQCNSAMLKQDTWLLHAQWQNICSASQQSFAVTAQQLDKEHASTRFVTVSRLMELLDYLEDRTVLLDGASTVLLATVILQASYFVCFAYCRGIAGHAEDCMSHLLGFIERCEGPMFAQKPSQYRPAWWINIHKSRFFMVKLSLQLALSTGLSDCLHPDQEVAVSDHRSATMDSLMDAQIRLARSCPDEMIQSLASNVREFQIGPMSKVEKGLLVSHLQGKGTYKMQSSVAFRLNAESSRLPGWVGSWPLFVGRHADSLVNDEPASATMHKVSKPEAGDSAKARVFDLAEIVLLLQHEPNAAMDTLIQLSPSMANMDLLSRALASASIRHLLKLYDQSADDIVRRFLQRNLRQLEIDTGADENLVDLEQCASLLAVFVRNVLSRGLIDANAIYLDVQELCTRYIWIPAVLEFRQWLQTATTSSLLQGSGGGFMDEEASRPLRGG